MQGPRSINMTRRFIGSASELPKTITAKLFRALLSLSRNPDSGALHLEKLSGRAKDLWSFRVDQEYRVILSLYSDAATLYFVGTHQDAYRHADGISPEMVVCEAAPHYDATATSVPRSGGPDSYLRVTPALVPPDVEISISGRRLASIAKYFPLSVHLLSLAGQPEVQMTFADIETAIGASLPASATKHRPWWANDPTHVQAIAWIAAGYTTKDVDMKARTVCFKRGF